MSGIAELSRLLASRTVPLATLHAVQSSRYAPRVLHELDSRGPLASDELANSIALSQVNNLNRIVRPLEAHALLAKHRFGKKVVHNILPLGRAVVDRFGDEISGQGSELRSKVYRNPRRAIDWIENRFMELLRDRLRGTDKKDRKGTVQDLINALAEAPPDTIGVLARALRDRSQPELAVLTTEVKGST